MSTFSRRNVLRGMMNGAAVSVGLPFLEIFLNGNGTALADGAPLPTRFGTWFWGLGMNKDIFTPTKLGADYDLKEQTASWKDIKQHVSLLTGFDVELDGRPNVCHYSGWVTVRTGEVPINGVTYPGESIDVTIADSIATGTRFRSLELAANANPRSSMSFRSTNSINPPEVSATEFYQKVFGSEFQDPNAPDFHPDPRIMTRKSVLSAVMDRGTNFRNRLGAADKARLDEYFTAIRGLESRLALQLEKPAPAPQCKIPPALESELPVGVDTELLATRHNLMTDLLVMAIACNQTKVFNMLYSDATAGTSKKGLAAIHHTVTHEEPVDTKLGYQPQSAWFVTRALESFAYFIKALSSFKEGDGTLLDHSLVFAHTDLELAQIHSLKGLPMMFAGTANGRIKNGLHINGNSSPVTRAGLTAMQALGLQTGEWGARSMRTNQPISELLA